MFLINWIVINCCFWLIILFVSDEKIDGDGYYGMERGTFEEEQVRRLAQAGREDNKPYDSPWDGNY